MHTLHYIFDPLCGWCYGAAPLIAAAREVPGLNIVLHGGGLLTGARRSHITPEWRAYVIPHDERIAHLSGQPFGDAYTNGLLRDTSAMMDSAPPSSAILAAEELGRRGLDMLQRILRAHYAEGRRVADTDVLVELARELGLDPARFAATFAGLAGDATERHFAESRDWLARVGGQGFPTLVLERADGTFERLELFPWMGRVDAWRDHLRQHLTH